MKIRRFSLFMCLASDTSAIRAYHNIEKKLSTYIYVCECWLLVHHLSRRCLHFEKIFKTPLKSLSIIAEPALQIILFVNPLNAVYLSHGTLPKLGQQHRVVVQDRLNFQHIDLFFLFSVSIYICSTHSDVSNIYAIMCMLIWPTSVVVKWQYNVYSSSTIKTFLWEGIPTL